MGVAIAATADAAPVRASPLPVAEVVAGAVVMVEAEVALGTVFAVGVAVAVEAEVAAGAERAETEAGAAEAGTEVAGVAAIAAADAPGRLAESRGVVTGAAIEAGADVSIRVPTPGAAVSAEPGPGDGSAGWVVGRADPAGAGRTCGVEA